MTNSRVSSPQERVKNWLQDNTDADAVLLTSEPYVRWYCGFAGSFGWVYQTREKTTLISDHRYAPPAKEIAIAHGMTFQLYEDFKAACAEDTHTVALDHNTTLLRLQQVERIFPKGQITPLPQDFGEIRRAKTPYEIQAITHAQNHVDEVLVPFLKETLHTGITEQQLAYRLKCTLEAEGRFELAFDTIVAFGEHTAIPHHTPTTKKLELNTPILIDLGARYQGYCSDMTRNVYWGTPTTEYREKYATLLRVQSQAIQKCLPGTPCAEIDTWVRKQVGGESEYFTHGLGHGVGIEIHEAPTLNSKSEQKLRSHDIITIEPGLYYEGRFGIRIEDLIHVTSTGVEILSSTDKELLIFS